MQTNGGTAVFIGFCICGGIAFGIWQESISAGIFAAFALFAIWTEK